MNILEDIGLEPTLQDCVNVAYVCSVISTRAAYICAAGLFLYYYSGTQIECNTTRCKLRNSVGNIIF